MAFNQTNLSSLVKKSINGISSYLHANTAKAAPAYGEKDFEDLYLRHREIYPPTGTMIGGITDINKLSKKDYDIMMAYHEFSKDFRPAPYGRSNEEWVSVGHNDLAGILNNPDYPSARMIKTPYGPAILVKRSETMRHGLTKK